MNNTIENIEFTVRVPLNGYPAHDTTDEGLIVSDLELIRDTLVRYKATTITIDKLYEKIDTKAAEAVVDKLSEILVKIFQTTPVTDQEFFSKIMEAMNNLEYTFDIGEEIIIDINLYIPSEVIGLSAVELGELVEQ
jgi:hypothetical protein